jgi:hypothetical protein
MPYSYVINNPLKYTDPTGNEIDGGASWRAQQAACDAAYQDHMYEYTSWTTFLNAEKRDFFRDVMGPSGGGGGTSPTSSYFWVFSSRFEDETFVVSAKKVYYIDIFTGIKRYNYLNNDWTPYYQQKAQGGGGYPGINIYEGNGMSGGITVPPLGIFVEQGAGTDLKQHEYGHYLQYKNMGALGYYKNIALPSLYNAAENKFETWLFGKPVFSVPHSFYRTETDANRNSINFFGTSLDKSFNTYFPTNTQTTPFTWYERLGIYYMIACPTCPR